MEKLSWQALNLCNREIAFYKILLLWGHPNPLRKNPIRAKNFYTKNVPRVWDKVQ